MEFLMKAAGADFRMAAPNLFLRSAAPLAAKDQLAASLFNTLI
jgi:hypothetical protein